MQIVDQRLLRRTSAAGIPLDGPLVDHDGKSEPRMGLGLRHDLQRRLIQRIPGSIPIEDHTIDSTAHHVINLIGNFGGVGRVISDVHMVRLSEPQDHVGVNLRRIARIKQVVNVDLADISCAEVAIRKAGERIRGAGVIGGLGG